MAKEKKVSVAEIAGIVKRLRREGKSIVTTNGVFDILHLGHITYLQKAKSLGNILIVGLNSDTSVKKIKGPNRPLNNENARASCLAALECVDYVVVFGEENPIKFLSQIRPSIHVKGGDYNGREKSMVERETIEKYGGKITLIEMVKGYSTTGLIGKIVKEYGK